MLARKNVLARSASEGGDLPRLRFGLTLVELLVVLVVLAILTTVAIQATSSVVDQGRYDATQRTLQNLQDATVSPVGQREPDGTPLITGFVADVGRLPNAVGTDPLTQLQELWANPNGLTAYSLQTAPSDAQVVLGCGWRGPYLQLPLGTTFLRDGWGNPLSLLQSDGVTAVASGSPIQWVRSLGADNAVGGVGYAADTDLVFVGTQFGATVDRIDATVSGTVYVLDSFGNQINPTGTVTVKFFDPNPATGTIRETTLTVTPSPTATFTFSTTIGPRVIRAYLGTVADVDEDQPGDAAHGSARRPNEKPRHAVATPGTPLMARRATTTIVLITRQALVRTDFRGGRQPVLANLWQQPRPELDDPSVLVEAALALGPKVGRQVFVLSTDFWSQTLPLPTSRTRGLTEEEVAGALNFEAETLSGQSALETVLGQRLLKSTSGENLYWVLQLKTYDRDRIADIVYQAGGRLEGLGHPSCLPRPLQTGAGGGHLGARRTVAGHRRLPARRQPWTARSAFALHRSATRSLARHGGEIARSKRPRRISANCCPPKN